MDLERGLLTVLKDLQSIDPKEHAELLELVRQISDLETFEAAKTEFLAFVRLMWPGFISGNHHKIMAKVVEDVVFGRESRVAVNLPPRFSKSEFFSYLMPAWAIGHRPSMKIIQICATADMAQGWSRKVRDLIRTEDYQRLFPGVRLKEDSKAAGRWHTSHGGEYFAVGAEGNVTGKGGDIVIIDDPTGEQQGVAAIGNPAVYDKVYSWYVGGPRQRLQPGGRICVVQSRWATNDFTGRLIKAERETEGENGDRWKIIELPAIMEGADGTKKSLWPEFWPLEQLEATRLSLPPFRWNAQYMQRPGNDSSAILKKEWWRRWPSSLAPKCDIKIITMDTAFSSKEGADYTAATVWGVFQDEFVPDEDGDKGKNRVMSQLILLDAWKERLSFPELKVAAHKYYVHWQPDIFIVEAQATGTPLLQELRARGIPVADYRPTRGTKDNPNTKIVRANSVSDILSSGIVWAPTMRWADDVIEECSQFPGGENDDYVDAVVMALMRFRQGGFIRLHSDYEEEWRPRRRVAYY